MSIQLIQRAIRFERRIALVCGQQSYTYKQLLNISQIWASGLRYCLQKETLSQERITFLCPPGLAYVGLQWAVWQLGGVAVPLCTTHPLSELLYVIRDSGAAACIVVTPDFSDQLAQISAAVSGEAVRIFSLSDIEAATGDITSRLPFAEADDLFFQPAMILYTSGTTGKPKGVVLTHQNLNAQITCLVAAWRWTADDYILHFLPLHHTHGIVNKLCCALWVGATVEMLPKFEAGMVWQRLQRGGVRVFMAVPTIYSLLIRHFEQGTDIEQQQWRAACRELRLMVSGSAALPVSVWQRWRAISGHCLLERYGMTEIGMALSNSYEDKGRVPGFVGKPLPGVSVKIVDEVSGQMIDAEGVAGELWVKGDNVFLGYWNKPDETEKVFCEGWFRTGDMVLTSENMFKIVGRLSTDIIKTGGYKVSALEIEDVLLMHPNIVECAVVGVPDDLWGERVGAAIIGKNGVLLTLEEVRNFATQYLGAYKLPSLLLNVAQLPRNAMGKITKAAVREFFLQAGK